MDADSAIYWLGWVRLAQLAAVFLVAVGVVAEFAGEWIGRPLEKIIDHARELQIAQLNNETARLSKENTELQTALFEARRGTANRNISSEMWPEISSKLAAFSGQTVEIVEFPINFEHEFLAGSIRGVLGNAGWNVEPAVTRLQSPPDGILVQGVMIRATNDERSQQAGKALFEALKPTPAGPMWYPTPLANPESPRLQVFIGDRPNPLYDWIKVK